MGEDLTDEEVAELMQRAGVPATGQMNFAQFAKMIMDGEPSDEPPKKGFFGLF